jgi:hypothetical protein
MATDPETRQQLARQGRLWLLALICATAGALVVWRTNSVVSGVIAFLATVAVPGTLLWAYERSLRRRKRP